ncbi:MAG TPA: YceI family protein [Steroidobacteraceae bacterium]
MTESKPGALAIATALLSTTAFADAPAGATHFSLDPAKSSLQFTFIQAGATNSGKFGKFPVALDAAADGSAASKLDVTVDMTSMDSGDKERDDTLRGTDLFSVAKFPQAHFTATQITKTAAGFDAVGKLTLRDVTRDQHVLFTLRVANEQGHPVAYLAGKTTIHRLDYGVGQGDWKSTEWVGADVTVSYNVRLVAAP